MSRRFCTQCGQPEAENAKSGARVFCPLGPACVTENVRPLRFCNYVERPEGWSAPPLEPEMKVIEVQTHSDSRSVTVELPPVVEGTQYRHRVVVGATRIDGKRWPEPTVALADPYAQITRAQWPDVRAAIEHALAQYRERFERGPADDMGGACTCGAGFYRPPEGHKRGCPARGEVQP